MFTARSVRCESSRIAPGVPLGRNVPAGPDSVSIACEHDLEIVEQLETVEALARTSNYWDPDEVVDASKTVIVRYGWTNSDGGQSEASVTLQASGAHGFTAADLLWALLSALNAKERITSQATETDSGSSDVSFSSGDRETAPVSGARHCGSEIDRCARLDGGNRAVRPNRANCCREMREPTLARSRPTLARRFFGRASEIPAGLPRGRTPLRSAPLQFRFEFGDARECRLGAIQHEHTPLGILREPQRHRSILDRSRDPVETEA